MPQMSGPVISHYRVLEKIGSGAMGDVFRARDERLGRDVALKLVRASSSGNSDHLRRFELEARAAAALNHPNIVAVYDVGVCDGSPYIVCELLEGKTLRQCLLEGPLPVRVAQDYALQMVQGLIAAHERRIVHRDLKPENLFVTSEGRVKILDFGVAKLQPSAEESSRGVEELTTVTRTGAMVGTVAYMSPEQLRGKSVDHRSDIFSVGAILYEMLAGRRAFRGETEVDTMTAVLREAPPEANLEQSHIPPSFRQIISHCLEKEPENRFQSARDLAFALETMSGPGTRSARSRSQYYAVRMLAGVGLLALAAAIFLLARNLHSQSAPTYRRLTFEEGTVFSARFTRDSRAIVYGAAWNGKPLQLFSTVGDSLLSQPLNLNDATLLALSPSGELALALHAGHGAHLEPQGGVMARAPLAGGSPREVLEDVRWADWDSKGEMAVVHHTQGRDRIEYPIGHVIYQSKGWISHLRFAPQSDQLAFMEHPSLWDDRGSVFIRDTAGGVRALTPEWGSEDGLAWRPDGNEIWFTAVETGINRDLLGATLQGKIRKILDLPASMTLLDVASDGRALVSLDNERLSLDTSARQGKPVNLSWHDWSIAKDISRDGQSVLFEDASEAAGSHYSVAIRNIDGTPPVQLGEGSAGGLSPDGKWAISIITGSPGQIRLLPIGAGQPRTVAVPGLEQIYNGSAHFLADGKHITVNANEPGHGVRCYVVDLEGGKPRPMTPEGVTGGLVSPDGQSILANVAGQITLFAANDATPHPTPNLEAGFLPLQWAEDGVSIYGYRPGQIPIQVYKVNLATGAKTSIQELRPDTSAGVVSIDPVVVNRDGSRFAYSYYQVFSVLYVVSGLQ